MKLWLYLRVSTQETFDAAVYGQTITLSALTYANIPSGGFVLSGKEKVTIKGGPIEGDIKITSWTRCASSDDSFTARMPSPTNVWRADVAATSGEIGTWRLIFGSENKYHATDASYIKGELVVDNSVAQLACYPADDTYLYAYEGSTTGLVTSATDASSVPAATTQFYVAGVMSPPYTFYYSRAMVSAVATSGATGRKVLTFAEAVSRAVATSGRYRLENAPEFMTTNGFYIINEASGRVYYYSTGSAPASASVTLHTGPLITLLNCTDCKLQTNVGNCRGTAIVVSGGTNNQILPVTSSSVTAIVIRNTGLTGVKLHGGTGNKLKNFVISNTGEAAIGILAGSRTTSGAPTRGNILVENGFINNPGRHYRTYKGAILFGGSGNTVRNLRIDDVWGGCFHVAGHQDASGNWFLGVNDYLFENISVTNALKGPLKDTGVFYHWGSQTSRGNCFRNFSFIWRDGTAGSESRVGCYNDGSAGWSFEDGFLSSAYGVGCLTNGGRAIRYKGIIFNSNLHTHAQIDDNNYQEITFAIQGWSSKSMTHTITAVATSTRVLTISGTLAYAIGSDTVIRIGTVKHYLSGTHAVGATALTVAHVPSNVTSGDVLRTNGSRYYEWGLGEIEGIPYSTWGKHKPTGYNGEAYYSDLANLGKLPVDYYGFPTPISVSYNTYLVGVNTIWTGIRKIGHASGFVTDIGSITIS